MPRRILGKGEARLGGVDAELRRRAVDRLGGPAVEHGMLADREGEACRRSASKRSRHWPPNWARRPARASRGATRAAGGPGPAQRRSPPRRASRARSGLVINEPAEQRRHRRLGEHGDADDQRRDMADRVDEQPLPDRPGCRARAQHRPVQSDGQTRSPAAKARRAAAWPRRTGWRGTAAGSGCKVAAGALDDDQIAGVEKPGEQSEKVAAQDARATIRSCPTSARRSRRRRAISASRLDARRPLAHQPQAPGGEDEARDIAEQGCIAELGQQDSGMPRGEVGGEEKGGEGDGARSAPRRGQCDAA